MAKKIKTKPIKRKLSTAGKQARAEKHELFCLEYIKDQNGSRAARDAGYSENGASVMAVRLLAKAKIKARIKKLLDERNARTLLEGDEILLEIKKLATSDVRRLLDPKTGCVLPVDQWPDDIAVCVASIEVVETFIPRTRIHMGYIKKIKLWDKPKPQELLGKNKALFTDVVKNEGSINVVSVDEAQVKATREKIKSDC